MNYKLLDKYNVDYTKYKPSSYAKMEAILQFCENNNLSILQPAFIKKGIGRNAFIRYNCNCGNVAESAVSNFLNKTVYACKKCNAGLINKIFKPIKSEKIIKQINKKGFEVLSYQHTTNLSNSSWTLKCKFGHVFTKKGNHLYDNLNYCPDCWVDSAEEFLMRVLIEEHFQMKFPKVRPTWLVNEFTNKTLELDMYNEELRLAFEYHGPQHYLPIYGEDRLLKSKRNDLARRNCCKLSNIQLIEIPYLSVKAINNFYFFTKLSQELCNLGFNIDSELPQKLSRVDFDFNVNKTQELISNLNKLLIANNKSWISGNYVNVSSIVKIKCNNCGCESEHKIKTLLNLKRNPTKYCIKCPAKYIKRTKNSIIRHTEISKKICAILNVRFSHLQFNPKGHVVGFWYFDSYNNELLIGIKRYKKYIKDLFKTLI